MDHVEELTVDVTDDDHWLFNAVHVRLVTCTYGKQVEIEQRLVLTVDCLDCVEDTNEALLFNLTLDHQVLPNQVHFRHRPSYSKKEKLVRICVLIDKIRTVTVFKQVSLGHGVLRRTWDIRHFAILARVLEPLKRVVLGRSDMALVRVMLNHFTFELN